MSVFENHNFHWCLLGISSYEKIKTSSDYSPFIFCDYYSQQRTVTTITCQFHRGHNYEQNKDHPPIPNFRYAVCTWHLDFRRLAQLSPSSCSRPRREFRSTNSKRHFQIDHGLQSMPTL